MDRERKYARIAIQLTKDSTVGEVSDKAVAAARLFESQTAVDPSKEGVSQEGVGSISSVSMKTSEALDKSHTAKRQPEDFASDDVMVRQFVQELITMSQKKKIVLAASDKLGQLQGRPVGMLESVRELKRNPLFKHLLKNVEIVVCPPENMHNKLQKYFGDSNTEVFTFVDTDEAGKVKGLRNKSSIRLHYLDDETLPIGAPYPLLEVVTISLLEYRYGDVVDTLSSEALEAIGIETVVRTGKGLTFTLVLPASERYDVNETVAERYARLKRLIRFA